jgi:hypothetical protein
MPDGAAAENAQSLGGAVLGTAMPELGVLRSGVKNHKGRLLLILFGCAVLATALLLAISWMNGKDANGGRRGARELATALVMGDPNAAPSGDAGYVSGVRSYFGPVSSAKVIGGHERGVNAPDHADERTYYVIEMLIQSKRGPAALELDFDDGAIGSDRISGVHELKPSEAPGLSAAQRKQLEAAFVARGGEPAGADVLNTVPAALTVATPSKPVSSHVKVATPSKPSIPHVPAVPKAVSKQLNKATKELSCIQSAHGDVAKLQACTQ